MTRNLEIPKSKPIGKPNSLVIHPIHYNIGQYEVIDVIEDWNLNFNLGNVVKYIARAGHKDDRQQDLEKALFYLKREIGGKKNATIKNE